MCMVQNMERGYSVCVFAVYVGISTLIEFIKEILSPLELTNYLNL